MRSEAHAAADLKQEQRNQQRLQKPLTIDVARHLHHRTIGVRPEDECKVIQEVQRQKDGNDAKCGYAVGDAHRRRRRIGGRGAGVLSRQNPASAVIPSQADSWPVVRANQVASPSMVQPAGIK